MNQQQVENLMTSPHPLTTECDQNEDRILLNTPNSKIQLFKSEQEMQSYKSQNIMSKLDEYNNKQMNKMNARNRDDINDSHKQKNALSEQFNHINYTSEKINNTNDNNTNKNINRISSSSSQIKQIQSEHSVINNQQTPRYTNNSNNNINEQSQQLQQLNKSKINQISLVANAKLKISHIAQDKTQNKKSTDGFRWLSLKKRIDSLKYLLRNLELSSLIVIKNKLTNQHKLIINDLGSNLEFDDKQTSFFDELVSLKTIFAFITSFIYKLFKHFPLINSTGNPIAFFQTIIALQLIYQLFQLPFISAFPLKNTLEKNDSTQYQNNETQLNIFTTYKEILLTIFVIPFIIEIFVNMNMSIYHNGEYIGDRQFLIQHYLKKKIIWDIAGIALTIIINDNSNIILTYVLFFLRLIKFKAIYNAIEEKFQLSLRYTVPFTLTNLILSITVIAHVCGCMFHWIGVDLHNKGEESWLDKAGLINQPLSDRYISSLYFSFITMISVGYGDITPANNIEKLFVTFITVFSCGTFAYVVNTIGILFDQMARSQAIYRQQKYEISNYMQNRDIDSELQTKVFQYIEMLRQKKQQEPESGQNVLQIMNSQLRESIYTNYYGRYLKTWPIFSTRFSTPFLDYLSLSCKELIFGPGETIYYEEQEINNDLEFHDNGTVQYHSSSQSIYLIIKGKILLNKSHQSFKFDKKIKPYAQTKYTNGESFGIREFFCGIRNEFTAESKGLTTVIKIQRSHFLDALKRFPKDYEAFAMIRDDLTFREPDKYVKCEPCERYDHSLYCCPRMHFLKRKQKAIYHHLNTQFQPRKQTKRWNKSKINALGINSKNIKEKLKAFRVDFILGLQNKHLNNNDGEKEEQQVKKELKKDNSNLETNNIFFKQIENNNNKIHSQEIELESSEEDSSSQSSSSSQSMENSNNNIDKKQEKKNHHHHHRLSLDQRELLSNKTELLDELFYFKCPILYYDGEKYIVSKEQDEIESNIAIIQYFESEANHMAYQSNRHEQYQFNHNNNNNKSNPQNDSIFATATAADKSQTNNHDNVDDNTQQKIGSNKLLQPQPKENNNNNNTRQSREEFQRKAIKKITMMLQKNKNIVTFNNIKQEDTELIPFSQQSLSLEDIHFKSPQHIDQQYIQDHVITDKEQQEKQQQQQQQLQLYQDDQNQNTFDDGNQQLIQLNSSDGSDNKYDKKIYTPKFSLGNIHNLSNNNLSEDIFNKQSNNNILEQNIINHNNNSPLQNNEINININEKNDNQFSDIFKKSLSIKMDNEYQFSKNLKNNNNNYNTNNNTNTNMNNNQESLKKELYNQLQTSQNYNYDLKDSILSQSKSLYYHLLDQSGRDLLSPSNNSPDTINENNTNFQEKQEEGQQQNHSEIHNIDDYLRFIMSFDKQINYTKYYSKGNMSIIINKYIKYQNQFANKFINNLNLRQRNNKITPRTPQANTNNRSHYHHKNNHNNNNHFFKSQKQQSSSSSHHNVNLLMQNKTFQL